MAMKIAVDAGHYLKTPGKRLPRKLDEAQTREWTLNDRLARFFAQAAEQYDVEILRVDDPTGKKEVSLAERCRRANAWGADFYLSVHHNAGANLSKAGGIVAFSYKASKRNSAKFRDAIYNACLENGGIRGNRAEPLTTANFYVLKKSDCPAVLMEYGFMDSVVDYAVILQEDYSRKMGYATMEGIARVAGLTKKTREKTVEQLAREVIAGKWGVNPQRKQLLGERYEAVQARVNQILREEV